MFKLQSLTKEDMATCDGLFDSLDLDSGGDLDLQELQQGLENIIAEAGKSAAEQEVRKNKLDEFEARAALCERAALALETVEATKAELATLVEKQDIESRAGRALLKHSKTGSVDKLGMEAAPAEQAESQSGKLVELRSVVTGLRTCGLDDDEEELLQMLSRACNIEDGSSAVDNQVLGAAVQGWMDARAASDLTIKDLRVRLDEELSAARVRLRAAKVGK
jgi:hypothetical protein